MSSQTWRDEICRKSLWAFKLSRHSPHKGTGQIWSWKSLEFEWRVWLQEFAQIHKNSVQPCGKWTSVDIANYLFIFLFFWNMPVALCWHRRVCNVDGRQPPRHLQLCEKTALCTLGASHTKEATALRCRTSQVHLQTLAGPSNNFVYVSFHICIWHIGNWIVFDAYL